MVFPDSPSVTMACPGEAVVSLALPLSYSSASALNPAKTGYFSQGKVMARS
jgi:hypothetical protein